MAKDKLIQYDSNAANNLDCGSVNLAENSMLPSDVNNYAREIMSHLKEFADGTSGINVLSLTDDTDTNQIKVQAPSSVTTTTTFTLPDGDGDAYQVLKTDGSGTLDWVNVAANPNLIINGAMTVSQRGTSQASVGYNGGYFAAPDRFRFYNPTQAVWTLSQSTEAPDGFSNSYKIDCTTADTTVAADHTTLLEYRFEGQDLQHLKKGTSSALSVTASFWVRSAKTGTYILEFRDGDNNRSISKSYTVSSADTWEYKTITFDGDTTGTLDNDNGNSMSLLWWLAAGSDYTSGTLQTSWGTLTAANQAVGVVNLGDSTSNDWHITGVKLEVGSTATDFVHESYGDTLAKCQRYYYQIGPHTTTERFGVDGLYSSSSGAGLNIMFSHPAIMRDDPDVTVGASFPGTTTFTTDTQYIFMTTTGHSAGRVSCEISSGTTTVDAEL